MLRRRFHASSPAGASQPPLSPDGLTADLDALLTEASSSVEALRGRVFADGRSAAIDANLNAICSSLARVNQELGVAVQLAQHGEAGTDSRCSLKSTRVPGQRRAVGACPLTPREVEVLGCLAEGMVYKQIAFELQLSASTVRSHLHHIYVKTGTPDRAQVVLLAAGEGWL